MIRNTNFPDKKPYLVNTKNNRKKNSLSVTTSLSVVVALCALSIWLFTPVSNESNRTQNAPIFSHNNGDEPNQIITKFDTSIELEYPAPSQPSETASETASETTTQTLIPTSNSQVDTAEIDNTVKAQSTPSTSIPTLATVNIQSAPLISEKTGHSKTYVVDSGDTLTKIFAKADLPISQAIKLAQTKSAKQLNNLAIGKTLRIYFDANDQWETLEYDINKRKTLIITPSNGEFTVSTFEKEVEYQQFAARGTIESSLSIAAEKAGISNTLSHKLTDIYKWEIDFARDLRRGDTFSVVYQKVFVDGVFLEDGPILAASFTNRGKSIEAIRYTDSEEITAYFQPNGDSLKRGFLRTPVKLARITSGFGNRKHPIKKTWKKHMGVDYGAKRGTPILATADGVVQYAGRKGGYGRTVILRHGGIYTTLYAHMSKLGKGVRSGKAVTQGQTIGYVGRSGWATGDHLHYEFRINGRHKNPLKVDLPKTLPLAKKEVDSFNKQAEPLLVTLTNIKSDQVASSSNKSHLTLPLQ